MVPNKHLLTMKNQKCSKLPEMAKKFDNKFFEFFKPPIPKIGVKRNLANNSKYEKEEKISRKMTSKLGRKEDNLTRR